MHQLDDDIRLRPTGNGEYGVDISSRWQVNVGPNGGYIGAIMLAAMKQELGQDAPHTRSITCHFLSPSVPGAAQLAVATDKRGRSLSTLTAQLSQGARTIAIAIATFGTPRDAGEFCDLSPPAAAPPDTIDPEMFMNAGMSTHAPFRDNYDQRLAIGPVPPATAARGHVGGWTRFRDGRPFDDLAMVAIADSWFPSFMAKPMPGPMHAPTIDYAVHILQSLPMAQLTARDFILAEFETHIAAQGYLIEDGRLWSPDGRLMAVSRQLAVLFPHES